MDLPFFIFVVSRFVIAHFVIAHLMITLIIFSASAILPVVPPPKTSPAISTP